MLINNPFIGDQLQIPASKKTGFTGREIRERHPEGPALLRIHFMNPGRESVGRKPFTESLRIQKSLVNFLRFGPQYPVKPDGVGFHRVLL